MSTSSARRSTTWASRIRSSRCSCRVTTRALAVSRRVWGNVPRLGSIDPEQEPYKAELAENKITVIDLTKVKAGDKLTTSKFAEFAARSSS